MKLLRRTALAAAICLALFAGHLLNLQATGNFHPVVEATVYRSAQPSGADLRAWVRLKDIRSVINLRGQLSPMLRRHVACK